MDAVTDAVKALDRAFDALKASAFVAWDWVTSHWKLALFAFGPIGAAVYLIARTSSGSKRWRTPRSSDHGRGINAVMDPIRNLLDLLGRIQIPKIPERLKIPGRSAPGHVPCSVRRRRELPAPPAPPAAITPRRGITINVYGAVDPEGTARAIRRVLDTHDRRQGRTPVTLWPDTVVLDGDVDSARRRRRRPDDPSRPRRLRRRPDRDHLPAHAEGRDESAGDGVRSRPDAVGHRQGRRRPVGAALHRHRHRREARSRRPDRDRRRAAVEAASVPDRRRLAGPSRHGRRG